MEPGDNHIRFGAKSHFGDVTIYKLLVTRETERSGEATLAALALSRGVLEPPFHSDVLSYRTRVAGDSVALSVQTTQGGSVAVQGIGPDGKLLRTEGLAVLELGAGENAIIVSVTGGEGSAARHYLIRAEASDIVRDVLAGDLISIPDDCDGAVGCPGTLNGVKGRFACGRGGAASNSGDAGPPADAPCSISPTSDGGLTKVGSAVGWYFWVFPSKWQEAAASTATPTGDVSIKSFRSARGSPLVPVVTVKESYDLAGSPTTWGVPEYSDNIADTDSAVVEKYRGAGAVVFGKTNVPFMPADWQSFNAIYGTCNNPWNLARTPGGSSGGSAAALAAGLTGLDAGSDIGASIRNPAHYCGVFGHKPTWEIVSDRGQALPGDRAPTDIAGAIVKS